MHVLLALLALSGSPETPDVGPLVRALWLIQRHGTPEALDPANDQRVKGVLSKALAKDGAITLPELGGLMESETFQRLSGPDATLDAADIARALAAASPESRARLAPKLREHADYLATTFDLIDEPHRLAGEKLAHWITANYAPGKPLYSHFAYSERRITQLFSRFMQQVGKMVNAGKLDKLQTALRLQHEN